MKITPGRGLSRVSHLGFVTAVPRAVGRTYANMFTFKHPWVAIQQWAQVGAMLFDWQTTYDLTRRCPTCVETGRLSLFHNDAKPPVGRMIANAIMVAGFEPTHTQVLSEGFARNFSSPILRNAYSLTPIVNIIVHVRAGQHNMQIPSSGTNP